MSNYVLLIYQSNVYGGSIAEELGNTLGALDPQTKKLRDAIIPLSQTSALIDMSECHEVHTRFCVKCYSGNQGYISIPVSSVDDIKKWVVGGDALQEAKASLKRLWGPETARSSKDRISSMSEDDRNL